jgi:HlyD family secretion protein
MRTIAGVLALAVAIAGCSLKRQATESAAHVVDRGDIEITVVETGKIEAVQDVEVKSRVSGRIAKLYVQEGDRVEKGQLIAEIDPQEIRLQLEQTTAQLRSAEAGAKRSLESVQLTRKQLETALQQAEARFIQAKREFENQPALTDANLRQARINLEQAQRDLDLLKYTTHPQQRVQAEADLRRTKAAADTDKANYERLVGLLAKGYVAQRDVDNARAQMEASQAAYRTAQENYDRLAARQAIELRNAEQAVASAQAAYEQAKARANLDKNKEQAYLDAKAAFEQAKEDLRRIKMEEASLAQARAQADQIRSAVADARRQLSETKIVAPMSGVITRKLVEEGELVAALSSFSGGTPIVQIAQLGALQVTLNINEIDVARLEVDLPAIIEIDALPDEKFMGRVTRIAPASDAAASTSQAPGTDAVVRYKVEVQLDKSDPRIKPGMSAKCTIRVEERKNVIRVPIEYVGEDEEGYFVMVRKAGAKQAEKTRVKIGLRSSAWYEVLEGVGEGARLEKPPYSGPSRRGFMQAGPEESDSEGNSNGGGGGGSR